MNYQKIHDQIIDRSSIRILNGYKERHHIIPKCLGGTDDISNLVDLTAREHFIIHLLLCKLYPKNIKLSHAIWMMANAKRKYQNRYIPNSRLYETIKLEHSKNISGKNNPFSGKTHSKEHTQKLKEINSRPKSEEHKRKISETLKGHKPGNMVEVEIEGIIYESITDAVVKTGINMSTLRNRIKSKSEKYKNYKLCKIDY
jgi:hypothetical protein